MSYAKRTQNKLLRSVGLGTPLWTYCIKWFLGSSPSERLEKYLEYTNCKKCCANPDTFQQFLFIKDFISILNQGQMSRTMMLKCTYTKNLLSKVKINDKRNQVFFVFDFQAAASKYKRAIKERYSLIINSQQLQKAEPLNLHWHHSARLLICASCW